MEFYYVWVWLAILFLIIEILTFTFYWLSLAIWAFSVSLFVFINGDKNFSISQALIFVIISSIFAIFAVKYLRPKAAPKPVWLDNYIWTYHKLEKVWNDFKLKIDWVDYLIDDDCINDDFSVWKKIKILSHKSWSFMVELV